MSKTRIALVLPSVMLLSFACKPTDYVLIDEPVSLDSVPGLKICPPEQISENCWSQKFIQPEKQITNKVDLLFVVDSSGSLDKERVAVANQIDHFIKKLPSQTHYRIGVMLAHSSKSKWAGRLYHRTSKDPPVLDSQQMNLGTIISNIRNRVRDPISDLWSDGGESHFYSLYRGLQEDRFNEARSQGFYRPDAALSVIFISDENEMCYQYPTHIKPAPDYDFWFGQSLEKLARDRDCTQKYNTQDTWLDHNFIYQRLLDIKKGYPLAIASIIYTDPLKVPRGIENEFGYGFVEITELAEGVLIDISDKDYSNGLAAVGANTAFKMTLYNEFPLSTTQAVDPASLKAWIDGVATTIEGYDPQTRKVKTKDFGQSSSEVEIQFCTLPTDPEDGNASQPGGGGNTGDGGGSGGGEGGNSGDNSGDPDPECTAADCPDLGI